MRWAAIAQGIRRQSGVLPGVDLVFTSAKESDVPCPVKSVSHNRAWAFRGFPALRAPGFGLSDSLRGRSGSIWIPHSWL